MRLQLLLLPLEDGDDGKTVQPFSLVVDQREGPLPADGIELSPSLKELQDFGDRIGSVGMLVTSDTVDVRQEQYAAPLRLLVAGEDDQSERAQIVAFIENYFAPSGDDVFAGVRILCERIERGEHMPSQPLVEMVVDSSPSMKTV